MHAYFDIIARSVAVYFFMIITLRLFGKKELSQLNTTDVILILLISNAVQNAMVGPDTSLTGGIAAALVLFVLNFIIRKIQYNSKSFNSLLEGKPEILVHSGIPNYKMLAKLSISHEELMEAIHEHGIENIAEVKLAILEMDGNISIISGDKSLKQTHYKRRKNRRNLVKMG